MKKFWKYMVAVAAACVALVMAGCGGEDKGLTLEGVKEAYGSIASAVKVEEKIEIKSGSLVQYTEAKSYVSSGDLYTVQITTKQLNKLTDEADGPYTEATESYTVSKSEAFPSNIVLDEGSFERITVEGGTLTAEVKEGKEKEVFSLDTVSPVSDMAVVFTVENARLGRVNVTYTSGASQVTVTVTFTY